MGFCEYKLRFWKNVMQHFFEIFITFHGKGVLMTPKRHKTKRKFLTQFFASRKKYETRKIFNFHRRRFNSISRDQFVCFSHYLLFVQPIKQWESSKATFNKDFLLMIYVEFHISSLLFNLLRARDFDDDITHFPCLGGENFRFLIA